MATGQVRLATPERRLTISPAYGDTKVSRDKTRRIATIGREITGTISPPLIANARRIPSSMIGVRTIASTTGPTEKSNFLNAYPMMPIANISQACRSVFSRAKVPTIVSTAMTGNKIDLG